MIKTLSKLLPVVLGLTLIGGFVVLLIYEATPKGLPLTPTPTSESFDVQEPWPSALFSCPDLPEKSIRDIVFLVRNGCQEGRCQGVQEVCTVNKDGSGLARLAELPQRIGRTVDWPPNKKQIAFVAGDWGSVYLYVMNVDGSELTQLTDDLGFVQTLKWSPDGTKIAFIKSTTSPESGYDDQLFVISLDSPEEYIQLTQDISRPSGLSWSPDSTKLVFNSSSPTSGSDFGPNITYEGEIYVINADGSGLVNLTNSPDDDCCAAWTPNGSTIVFQTDTGSENTYNLYSIGLENSSKVPFVYGRVNLAAPIMWTPDGLLTTQVATHNQEDFLPAHDIFIFSSDKTETVNLTNSPFDDRLGSWSSDGSTLLFVSNRETNLYNYNLFLAQSDGSNLRAITDLPETSLAFFPAWMP